MTCCSAEVCLFFFLIVSGFQDHLQKTKLVALQNTNWLVTHFAMCVFCGQAAEQ